ncbi:MAG: hypothetical protein H6Q90_1713, partial [Deltaproteobacteria bacterium]|nr:hypothetical protein [Deltaproteobacteria bacterium]
PIEPLTVATSVSDLAQIEPLSNIQVPEIPIPTGYRVGRML